MHATNELRRVERDLNEIIAAITQVSGRQSRRARRVAQVATGKITGAATMSGMLVFISAFGAASTGTAIGTLSGAAATSAKMYWIGSIFGMGAVAGAIILPAAGAIFGLVAAFYLSRAVFGRPRNPNRMEEFEVRALFASMSLIESVTPYLRDGVPAPTRDELRIFAHEGLLPLCALIGDHLRPPANPNETDKACHSFASTLAPVPRRKLRRHHRRLTRRAVKLARPKRKIQVYDLRQWLSRSPSNA